MTEPNPFDPPTSEVAPPSGTDGDLEFSTPEQPPSHYRPWGPWATIGWTLLCVVVISVAQIAALFVVVLYRIATGAGAKLDDLGTNGNLLVLATLISTLSTVGLIAFLIRVRRCPIRDYLALSWPPTRSVMIALAGLAVLLVATDLIPYLLGRPLIPAIIVGMYRTAWLPALLFAFVVLAPLGEETLFRGFLYEGIAVSRAGPIMAIIASSAAWALMHAFQYDLYGVLAIAAGGLYLGVVRLQTQSLFLTMLLHAVQNAAGTLELIVQEHWLK